MSNHTPGPWFGMLVETDKADHFHISSPTGEICDLPMRKHSTLPPSLERARVESDARLIASAPELLDLAKDALAQIEKMDFSCSANWNCSLKTNAVLLLNVAIAKAEGIQ